MIDDQYVKNLEQNYKSDLEDKLEGSRKIENTVITPFMEDKWKSFSRVEEEDMLKTVDTSVSKKLLYSTAKGITKFPKAHTFLRTTERLISDRNAM